MTMLYTYLAVSIFCLFTYCLATKAEEEDVTIGMLVGFIVLSLVPFLNFASAVCALFHTAYRTGFWDKKLF